MTIALSVGIVCGATVASASGHQATWQQVRAQLHSDGIAATRDIDHASVAADSVGSPPASSPVWYVWVFKGGRSSTDEIISGHGWRMDLSNKRPGRIYWTKFIPLIPSDPSDKAGGWYGIKLYGSNLALVFDVFRYAHRAGVPPPTLSQMPGAFVAIDESLTAVTS